MHAYPMSSLQSAAYPLIRLLVSEVMQPGNTISQLQRPRVIYTDHLGRRIT